jgi:AcrR family transcriptional regulator
MDDDILLISNEKAPRADATRNRQLILATAEALFKAHGVDNVTMSAIAEAAQVGKGTLYRHFADKAALCIALLDQDMRALQAHVLEAMGNPRTSPNEKLYWFLEEVVRYVEAHLGFLCESVNDPRHISTHQAHGWWRQTIRGLLTQINTAQDLDYLTDLLYILVDVPTVRYQLQRGYTLERMVDGLHTTLGKLLT